MSQGMLSSVCKGRLVSADTRHSSAVLLTWLPWPSSDKSTLATIIVLPY